MPPPSLNLYGLLFVLALRMRVSVKGMTVSPNYMEQVYCRNIPSKIPSNFPVARERSRLKASIQRNIYLAFQWLVGRLRLDANICERQCGWGGRIRTSAWWNQNPLPYHLATPQQAGSGSGGSRLPPSLRQRRSIEGVEPFQPAEGEISPGIKSFEFTPDTLFIPIDLHFRPQYQAVAPIDLVRRPRQQGFLSCQMHGVAGHSVSGELRERWFRGKT